MQLDGRWVLVARTGVYWLGRYCSPHWGVCHLCCPLTPRPRRAPSPSIIGSSRLALPFLFRPRRPLGVDPSSNLSRLLHPQMPQTSTVRGSQLNSHCGLRAHSPHPSTNDRDRRAEQHESSLHVYNSRRPPEPPINHAIHCPTPQPCPTPGRANVLYTRYNPAESPLTIDASLMYVRKRAVAISARSAPPGMAEFLWVGSRVE